MCYIKNIIKPYNVSYDQLSTNFPEEFQDQFLNFNDVWTKNVQPPYVKNQYSVFNYSYPVYNSEQLISHLTHSLQRNSMSIQYLNQKIQKCGDHLQSMMKYFDQQIQHQEKSKNQLFLSNKTSVSLQDVTNSDDEKSENLLLNKIFGCKKYHYKLCLDQEFPTEIYKERNIKIRLLLKNKSGKIIKNSNIINLCFALVDDNGKWINCNRVGDPMIKGKTQAQLYHGQVQFNKIYTKDISRTFLNGRVNIVIYNQPSILVYQNQTSQYEQYIAENFIEPLIIQGVVIKAKKKY